MDADGGVEAEATLTYAGASCTLLKMPPATVLFDLMVWARRLVSGEGVQVIRIHAVLARAAADVLPRLLATGLLRWPSVHWQLAEVFVSGDTAGRSTIGAMFAASNSSKAVDAVDPVAWMVAFGIGLLRAGVRSASPILADAGGTVPVVTP
jgi:hypothetical protein